MTPKNIMLTPREITRLRDETRLTVTRSAPLKLLRRFENWRYLPLSAIPHLLHGHEVARSRHLRRKREEVSRRRAGHGKMKPRRLLKHFQAWDLPRFGTVGHTALCAGIMGMLGTSYYGTESIEHTNCPECKVMLDWLLEKGATVKKAPGRRYTEMERPSDELLLRLKWKFRRLRYPKAWWNLRHRGRYIRSITEGAVG